MALRLGYSTLRWRNPDLPAALAELKAAGWDGWEGRLPLDWLGTPRRVKQVCDETGMPLAVFTASGAPGNRDTDHVERNRRRMEFAAEAGCDCFMFMTGPKPEGRAVNRSDLDAAADGAEAWAEYAAGFGLELSYHIHTNTLVDSNDDWRYYMGRLSVAKLCIDVSHAQLWGYEPSDSLRDFRSQLNYVHLQDYSSTSRADDGKYLPVWCDVGAAANVEFGKVLETLHEIDYSRWVTACPGEPIPGADDPVSEAKRSRGMVEYLRGLGY